MSSGKTMSMSMMREMLIATHRLCQKISLQEKKKSLSGSVKKKFPLGKKISVSIETKDSPPPLKNNYSLSEKYIIKV